MNPRSRLLDAEGDDKGGGDGTDTTVLGSKGKGDEGTGDTPFIDTVPEQFRADPALAPIKSLESLVKSFIQGQKLIGVPADQIVKLPGQNATPEDVQQFHMKLGMPEKVEDYDLKVPENVPEGYDIDEKFIKKTAEIFHKHGLSVKQAQAVYNDYNEALVGDLKSRNETDKDNQIKSMGKLKEDWGQAYDQNIDLAVRARNVFCDDDMKDYLENSRLGDDVRFIKFFSGLGKRLSEMPADGSGPGTTKFTRSPAEATQRITELNGDENFMKAYMTKTHAGHADAVQQMEDLMKQAHPD